MKRFGFTLIELLIVIAVIALLAALLFPAFYRARESTLQVRCGSNMHQVALAVALYVQDHDSKYPQEHPTSPNPARGTSATAPKGDYDGSLESPDYGSAFVKILPYIIGPGNAVFFVCPSDPDQSGKTIRDSAGNCLGTTPPAPPPGPLTSYLMNGYFLFGLSEPQLASPTTTIFLLERNNAFCNVQARPWLGEIYDAPGARGATDGSTPYPSYVSHPDDLYALASQRHNGGSNFVFADGHVKWENYGATIQNTPEQPYLGMYQALPGQPGPTP